MHLYWFIFKQIISKTCLLYTSEENIEEYVSLPTAIFGKGDFFILRASGQSMIEAGIEDVYKRQVYENVP